MSADLNSRIRELQAVVFDLDGTLVDSFNTWVQCFMQALHTFKPSEEEVAELFRRTAGEPIRAQIAEFLKAHGVFLTPTYLDNLSTTFRGLMMETIPPPLHKGARELLTLLQDQNIRCFVSTGGTSIRARRWLTALECNEFIDTAMGSEIVAKGPAHFHQFARVMGLTREEFCEHAAFFGDGAHDMRIASSSGLLSVGVAHTVGTGELLQAGADFVYPTLWRAYRSFVQIFTN